MYRPTISQLIERLENIKKQHGNLEVQGYHEGDGTVFDEVDAEYNSDEGSFCLLTLSEAEED